MRLEHPVQVDVPSPPLYDRLQLLVRLLFAMVLGAIGISFSWLAGVLYLLLPLIAATALAGREQLWKPLQYLLQVSAYMLLLTDRFPTRAHEPAHIDLRITGAPTAGSALLRLVTSIPSVIVLGILGIVSCFLGFIGILTILFSRTLPAPILAYQRAMLRWQARLLAYHASLVDEYPPFALDMGEEPTVPVAAGRVS